MDTSFFDLAIQLLDGVSADVKTVLTASLLLGFISFGFSILTWLLWNMSFSWAKGVLIDNALSLFTSGSEDTEKDSYGRASAFHPDILSSGGNTAFSQADDTYEKETSENSAVKYKTNSSEHFLGEGRDSFRDDGLFSFEKNEDD